MSTCFFVGIRKRPNHCPFIRRQGFVDSWNQVPPFVIQSDGQMRRVLPDAPGPGCANRPQSAQGTIFGKVAAVLPGKRVGIQAPPVCRHRPSPCLFFQSRVEQRKSRSTSDSSDAPAQSRASMHQLPNASRMGQLRGPLCPSLRLSGEGLPRSAIEAHAI